MSSTNPNINGHEVASGLRVDRRILHKSGVTKFDNCFLGHPAELSNSPARIKIIIDTRHGIVNGAYESVGHFFRKDWKVGGRASQCAKQ